MLLLFLGVILLGSVADSRVTFVFSEVLQESDLRDANRASFKCENGCNAYTDSKAENLYITEYDELTQEYSIVVNFANMGGSVASLRDPYVLPASTNYFIENRGERDPRFVFYVVDNTARETNFDTPVMVIDDDKGLDLNGESQMVTVLSSKYVAVRYTKLENIYKKFFPMIYSTGFDAAFSKDGQVADCKPFFKGSSRSDKNTFRSVITLFSPISTVDFGKIGPHRAHVEWSKNGLVTQTAYSSTVYSSPGYIGCDSTKGQSYSSSVTEIKDSFLLQANMLDVANWYNQVSKEETVRLQISEHNFDFYGSNSHSLHLGNYKPAKNFIVDVEWQRKTKEANWLLHLDFDSYDDDVPETPETSSGHVRFTYSEVLQETALRSIQNADRAPFKCDNGCNAYTDSRANNLYITEYDEKKDTYTAIVSFSNMGGANKNMPEPYKLEASENYFIENRGEKNPLFVFYVVDSKAPNINTPVVVIDEDKEVVLSNSKSRLVTILSSKYDSVQYSHFGGNQYPKNAPQIYATGFDVVDDKHCSPLYKSKSFYAAPSASVTVLSPISTVDFGYIGDPSVHVKPNNGIQAIFGSVAKTAEHFERFPNEMIGYSHFHLVRFSLCGRTNVRIVRIRSELLYF